MLQKIIKRDLAENVAVPFRKKLKVTGANLSFVIFL